MLGYKVNKAPVPGEFGEVPGYNPKTFTNRKGNYRKWNNKKRK